MPTRSYFTFLLLLSFSFLPLLCPAQDAEGELISPEQAADRYREMHEIYRDFARKLGVESGDPQRFFKLIDAEPRKTEATPSEHTSLNEFCHEFFNRLEILIQAPIAKGSNIEYFNKPKPALPFMLSSFALEINRLAAWYADSLRDKDPQKALEAVLAAARAGRHLNSEPTLTTWLIKLESDQLALKTLARLAPRMTTLRRVALVLYWETLPQTGTLKGALAFEREFYLKRLEDTLLSKKAAMPSNPSSESRQSLPIIPWEILIDVFGNDYYFIDADLPVDRKIEQLRQMGITPETALSNLREAQHAYSELAKLIETPFPQIERWAKGKQHNTNTFNSALPQHIEAMRRAEDFKKAFYLGLDILDQAVAQPESGSLIQYDNAWFKYESKPSGFRLSHTWNIPVGASGDIVPHLDFGIIGTP